MIEFATVARPYAKALFELAKERGQTQTWLSDLAQVAWLVQQQQVLQRINQSDLDATQKADELFRLLDDAEAIDTNFKNFVYIVAQEKRLSALPNIYEQYQQLLLNEDNAKEAVIYTAYEVASEGQRAKIVSDLEQRFNVRLQAHFEIDRELIGGLKAVVGDQVLDLSVQGKLQQLYTAMTN